MGEIAEMMLEGILCETCGGFIGGMAPGHPQNCGCVSRRTSRSIHRIVGRAERAERHNRDRHEAAKQRKPFECGKCKKLFRTEGGLAQHKRDTHDRVEARR